MRRFLISTVRPFQIKLAGNKPKRSHEQTPEKVVRVDNTPVPQPKIVLDDMEMDKY